MPEETARLQRTDHDTLIRLEAKLDSIATDVKEMRDGTTAKLVEHEARIVNIEKERERNLGVIGGIDNAWKRVTNLEQKVHDFETAAKTWRVFMGAIGGGVFFILTQLPNWIKIIF